MDIEDNRKIAKSAVAADDLATEPAERRALEAQGSVVQPTVSRSCSVGGAHVPWRPGQWKFIVVRQAGLQVTIEICCRCGMAYVEEVIEDGGQQ